MGSKVEELLQKKKEKNIRITAYVSPEIYTEITNFCDSNGVPVTKLVSTLVEEFLDKQRLKLVNISHVPQKLGSSGE